MNQFSNSFTEIQAIIAENQKEIFGSEVSKDSWDLVIYGSTVNALATKQESDLDLTIVIDDFEVSHEIILRNIKKVLETKAQFCEIKDLIVIQSGVLL